MTTTAPKGHRLGALTGAAYCVGFLLIAISILDFAGTVWPVRPSDVNWRYGAVGLLSGFTLTPLLGGLIMLVTAYLAGHRRTLVTLGAAHLVGALVLLFLLGGFALDTLQVRREAAEEVRRVAEVGAAKAAAKLFLTFVAIVWMGIAGVRRPGGRVVSPSPGSAGAELVVG